VSQEKSWGAVQTSNPIPVPHLLHLVTFSDLGKGFFPTFSLGSGPDDKQVSFISRYRDEVIHRLDKNRTFFSQTWDSQEAV